jgi:hypothetical protein
MRLFSQKRAAPTPNGGPGSFDEQCLRLNTDADPSWLGGWNNEGTLGSAEQWSLLLEDLQGELEAPDEAWVVEEISNTWVSVAWWGSVFPLMLQVSQPRVDQNGDSFSRVLLWIPIASMSIDDARNYIFEHNGQSSTTYAWVFSETGNVICASSVLVKVGDEESLRLAALRINEMYSACLGKITYAILASESGAPWTAAVHPQHPTGYQPPTWLTKTTSTSAKLRENGDFLGNKWDALEPGFLLDYFKQKYPELIDIMFGPRNTEAGVWLCAVPLLNVLDRSDWVENRLKSHASLDIRLDVHPYIGPGLRCLLVMPHMFDHSSVLDICNMLNNGEMQGLAGAPTSGCWMPVPASLTKDSAEICFHGFFASDYFEYMSADSIIEDCLRRAQYASAYLGSTDSLSGTAIAATKLVPDKKDSYEHLLAMLATLKNMGKNTNGFVDLRSALVEAIDKHASPSEAANIRAELAKLLW